MIGRDAISKAVAAGNLKYWEDARKQEAAFVKWRDGGFVGQCDQMQRGDIVEYITREVVAALYPVN